MPERGIKVVKWKRWKVGIVFDYDFVQERRERDVGS